MVAYIRQKVVEEKRWLDKGVFNEGVAIAQAVPGATAMQVATYVGLRLRGIVGGLASFLGFSLPAFALMLFLSWLYQVNHSLPQVHHIFAGLRVAVVAIVGRAFLDFFLPIAKRVKEVLIAFMSFLLFYLGVNPFLIIFACFVLSYILFEEKGLGAEKDTRVNYKKILALPLFPLVFLAVLYVLNREYFYLSLVMMKVDAFAFGGGYACLPLMLHQVVEKLHWMSRQVFMDGIALGQITPGPIVITATFVGFYLYGLIGAIVSTVSIFTPSFIIISVATELQQKIRHSTWFLRAKRGLIASFSGLLLFAELKFIGGVEWNVIKLFLGIALLTALLKRINILWVVVFTVIFSLLVPF